MVAFTIDSKCMDSFEAAILDCQDCIGKSSLERSAYGSSQNGPRIKKVVSLDLGDSQARTQKTSHSYLGEANETYAPRESQQVPGSGEEPSQHQDPRSKADPDTSESSVDQVSVEHSQAEEDLYNATPEKTQTKFATPEVEPIEPKPKLKPVTARGRKPVKPKAKPPIVPGRNALDSQLATAKLKSQAAKIQPATNYDGIAPKKTDTQSKPGASSKKLLPSTSTTNATKGGVKLKDPFRTVPAGKNSTKTISQANVKPTAKKPSEIGIAKSKQVALAHVFDPAYNFSDEIIATPDINDACAPKVSKTKLNDSPAKTATRSAASQSASNETKADKPVVLPHKRYSRPIKATGIIADGKDDDQPVDAKSKSTKESAKAKPGLLQAGSSEPETSNKANAKKRQSAPAALPATRKSQRAAALAAKDKMQGIDDRHDEDEIEASLPSKLKSNIAQEKKADETQEHKKSDSPSFSEDPAMIDLQAEDARSLGLVAGESPILQQGHDEDLYGASPRVPQQKPTPVPNLPKKLASPTATDEKKARNSGIDLANKLIDSLGDLESEPERHDEPESHVMKKPATIEGDTRSRAPQRYEEITDKEQSPSKGDEAPLSIGINEIAASSATPSAPEAPKSPALEERDPKVLPNAIFPPPAAQETIETEPETQIITNVLQTVPKQSFLAQPFHDGLISASQNADKVAVEEVISTEVRHIALNDSKKRKAVPARLTVMKRRRADQEETQVVEEHIPEIKVPAATTEVPNKPKSQPPSLVRKSPQLAARSAQLVGQLKIIAPEVSSAFKDPARKPKVINFTGRGPRNQGMVSAAKLKPATEPMGNQDEASPAAVHVADRKRKREAADFVELVSPSKKKLNSSPMDVQENDIMASQLESSTYKQIVQPKQERQRLVSRPSSQASRVDRNGSPKAIEGQIDHFGKLREKLASQGQYEPQESQTVPDTRTAVCEKPTTRPRRASQIFGPKISLGNKLKGRPSSPEEPNSRYIAHGENQGVYTDVDTKMVIEEKKILPDPFIERSRKSSTFIERLQSSSSKEHTAAKIQSKQMLDDRVAKPVQAILATVNRSSTEEDLLGLPREERVLDRGERKSGLMAQPARVKKPLYEVSSPNDMTSISSFGSQSSDVARTPLEEVPALNERWNLAVRPHYDSLGHAVHRIADELMIRLSGEEDRMGLLVNQYKENGMKILDAMSKQREIERESISRSLERKKSEIASVYTESRNVMMEMDGNRRGDSASQFEIEWRRKQSVIRKQIAEGQQLSEN
ncbi:hypothetical protein BKA65DRAFT_490449 [Rhexocercosporidium sp. MPI-PUGE-AT-0058]|nr:hypothetical protein BKA65DRAFT_490449 [Rhexocercosporidium sp. MPI-PUGE-AT-0058]